MESFLLRSIIHGTVEDEKTAPQRVKNKTRKTTPPFFCLFHDLTLSSIIAHDTYIQQKKNTYLHHSLEDVWQRQVRQIHIIRLDPESSHVVRRRGIGDKVLVRQQRALGVPRRARSTAPMHDRPTDQRRQPGGVTNKKTRRLFVTGEARLCYTYT